MAPAMAANQAAAGATAITRDKKNRRVKPRAAARRTLPPAQAFTASGLSRACSERPMRSIPFTTRSFGSAV